MRRSIVLALGLFAGCLSDDRLPQLVLLSDQPTKGFAGTVFTVEYAIAFSGDGQVDVYADEDGDLSTLGDRITIASGLTADDGVIEHVDWDTTGLGSGVYRIFVVLDRGGADYVYEAPIPVTLVAFDFPGSSATRMTMRGQIIEFSFAGDDPSGSATTDLYADGDANLATLADRFLISGGQVDQNGATQQVLWDTTDVPVGTYFIVAVFSEGPVVFGTFLAPFQVVVNDVAAMLPADGAVLLGTAANTRVRFALPLVGATIDDTTMPVTIGGLPVAGTYTIENGNRDVVFTPDGCFFPAPVAVRSDVSNTVAETTLPPATIRTATFTTVASRIYCGTSDGGKLVIVDPIGLAEIAAITIAPADAAAFAVASRGGLIFIGTSATSEDGSVVVFDAALNGVLGRVQLTKDSPSALVSVASVAFSPDETIAWAAGNEGVVRDDPDAAAFVSRIHVATRTETTRLDLSRQGRLRNLVVAEDGGRAYVANLDASVIHVIDLSVPAEVDTDGDGANGITPLPTAASPAGVELDAAGAKLFVTHANSLSVSVFETATFAPLAPLAGGGAGAAHAAVIRRHLCDGLLYAPRVAVTGIGPRPSVSVFDADAGSEVTPRLLVDSQGYYFDVAFVYGTTRAALADHDAGRVQVFDTEDLGDGAVGVQASIANMTTVTTIPPLRP